MKRKIILFFVFIFITISSFLNFSYAQQITSTQTTTTTPTPSQAPSISPTSPDAWRYFYELIRPSADVKCLKGNSAIEKIGNCIIEITKALRYLAVILFVFGLTYVAGLLVFSPFKQDAISQGKKILLWIILGFIILFIAEKIMEAIKWIATGE